MTRAMWLASTPKCPRDGGPLTYFLAENRWYCPVHGSEIRGEQVAARARPMRFEDEAA